MNIKGKIAAVGLGAVVLGGMIGVGVSYADDPTTSPAPSARSSAAPSGQPGKHADKLAGEHAKRTLVRRALHGQVTVGGKEKTRVIDFQRGAVEKVSGTSITLKSTDGFTATYVVNADTLVRKAGEQVKIADIKTGDKVRVVALKNGDTSTARAIREPKS